MKISNKERAMLIAEHAHRNQSYDIYPYMYHIKSVVAVAEHLGYSENIIIACYLHDTLEDTTISYNDIKKAFNYNVAEAVYCVSDGDGRTRKEKKKVSLQKIASNPEAILVKLCDRIANVEHSKNYNQSKFEMYKKENEDFVNSMTFNTHGQYFDDQIEKALEILKNLFESKQ